MLSQRQPNSGKPSITAGTHGAVDAPRSDGPDAAPQHRDLRSNDQRFYAVQLPGKDVNPNWVQRAFPDGKPKTEIVEALTAMFSKYGSGMFTTGDIGRAGEGAALERIKVLEKALGMPDGQSLGRITRTDRGGIGVAFDGGTIYMRPAGINRAPFIEFVTEQRKPEPALSISDSFKRNATELLDSAEGRKAAFALAKGSATGEEQQLLIGLLRRNISTPPGSFFSVEATVVGGDLKFTLRGATPGKTLIEPELRDFGFSASLVDLAAQAPGGKSSDAIVPKTSVPRDADSAGYKSVGAAGQPVRVWVSGDFESRGCAFHADPKFGGEADLTLAQFGIRLSRSGVMTWIDEKSREQRLELPVGARIELKSGTKGEVAIGVTSAAGLPLLHNIQPKR